MCLPIEPTSSLADQLGGGFWYVSLSLAGLHISKGVKDSERVAKFTTSGEVHERENPAIVLLSGKLETQNSVLGKVHVSFENTHAVHSLLAQAVRH